MAKDQGHIFEKEEVPKFVKRITALENEKSMLAADISAVYEEAKKKNFNVKALREAVKFIRKKEQNGEEVLDTINAYYDAGIE